ncbi:MAG TPA: stage II sporulation protein M, partial [Gemmataceae bacterium]|nr:stage II sporulation protein M [Gemmataceae bacterium]
MDLATFIQQRRPQWRRLEILLQEVEGSGLRSLDEQQAVEFGRLYRSAASDLNQAQTFVSGDATVQYLNDLVARCYLAIYRKTKVDLWGLLRYLVWGYPAVFRRYFHYFVLATVITAVGVVFGAAAARHDPDLALMYLVPDLFNTIKPEKEADESRTVAPTSGELVYGSVGYFTHNITVSLYAFALGLTFGVGTALLMFQNGVIMGVLGVIFANAGQFKTYCAEILPHGVLEFPA